MKHVYINWIKFLTMAGMSFALFWFVFQMRYWYYPQPVEAILLDRIFVLSNVLMILILLFYPSRILICVVGTVCFILPPFLRSESFPQMNLPMFLIVGFLVSLLAIAAYIRQHVNDGPEKSVSDGV